MKKQKSSKEHFFMVPINVTVLLNIVRKKSRKLKEQLSSHSMIMKI